MKMILNDGWKNAVRRPHNKHKQPDKIWMPYLTGKKLQSLSGYH